mmetsp:Transcript_12312/g.31832  ORF Transcript_12312/g.31832 Transcript_12312/m.31832 type:complete len:207 (+) Transcript_12312:155-775(+)
MTTSPAATSTMHAAASGSTPSPRSTPLCPTSASTSTFSRLREPELAICTIMMEAGRRPRPRAPTRTTSRRTGTVLIDMQGMIPSVRARTTRKGRAEATGHQTSAMAARAMSRRSGSPRCPDFRSRRLWLLRCTSRRTLRFSRMWPRCCQSDPPVHWGRLRSRPRFGGRRSRGQPRLKRRSTRREVPLGSARMAACRLCTSRSVPSG